MRAPAFKFLARPPASPRRSLRSRLIALLVALASVVCATRVDAQERDGMYGRLEGDATLRAGVGAAMDGGSPSGLVEAGLSYLRTAGGFVRYADALGAGADPFDRSIAVGAELSPLFLARMANDLEHGPAVLDLTLDSLSFGVGTFWHRDAAGWSPDPGLEIAASLDVPLSGSATGPFLGVRGALRWRHTDLAGTGEGGAFDRGSAVSFVVGWQHVVGLGIADGGDAAIR